MAAMLDQFIGQKIVMDLASPYVCLGTLVGVDEHFLEVRDADIHDLRDSDTTRENYVAASFATGIKRNRRRTIVARREIVALARFEDIVDE
jgi:hypothetical protein